MVYGVNRRTARQPSFCVFAILIDVSIKVQIDILTLSDVIIFGIFGTEAQVGYSAPTSQAV